MSDKDNDNKILFTALDDTEPEKLGKILRDWKLITNVILSFEKEYNIRVYISNPNEKDERAFGIVKIEDDPAKLYN